MCTRYPATLTVHKSQAHMPAKEKMVNEGDTQHSISKRASCDNTGEMSELREPNISCGPNGSFYNVLDENSKVVFVVCYDTTSLTPLYAVHKLKLNLSPGSLRSQTTFLAEKYIYGPIKINIYYKTHAWKFMELFEKEHQYCAYQYFCSSSVYLERGQLVPDADFESNGAKTATFNYINTAPQFQNVNQGDWFYVEQHVRKMAANFLEARRDLKTFESRIKKGERNVKDAKADYETKSSKAKQITKSAKAAFDSADNKNLADLGAQAAKAGKLAESSLIHYIIISSRVAQASHAAKAARSASNTLSPETDAFTIVTGVLGIARLLKDAEAKKKGLYLGGLGRNVIPVPLLFWKAVIYPTDDRGSDVIFLRSNYYSEKTKNICKNVCDEIGYVKIPKSSADNDAAVLKIPEINATLASPENCVVGNERNKKLFELKVNREIIYKVCYDTVQLTPIYTVHVPNLEGNAVRSSKFYKDPGLHKVINIDRLYDDHVQKFEKYFKNKCDTSEYFSHTNYLARGHLVPDADFKSLGGKKATSNYINIVPQFQNVNNGDWKSVEGHTRKRCRDEDVASTVLKVITGVVDIQQIECSDRNETLFLDMDKKKIPVPRLLWKAVVTNDSDGGRIYIRSNYIKDTVDPMCDNLEFRSTAPATSAERGCAFLTYFSPESAANAQTALHEKQTLPGQEKMENLYDMILLPELVNYYDPLMVRLTMDQY
ncbi:hypothetical protein DMENIID0001_171580 [Sergentomyia squamirostris]